MNVVEFAEQDEPLDGTEDEFAAAFAAVLDADPQPRLLKDIVSATADDIYAAMVEAPEAHLIADGAGAGNYGRHYAYLGSFLQGAAYFYILHSRGDLAA